MTTVTKSIVINAPRQTLRPYFDDAERVKERSSNLYRWEPDEAWPNAGATCKVGFKATGVDVRVIAYSDFQEAGKGVFSHQKGEGTPWQTR